VGHPGHELRIHHWLETIRPCVHVLTDGSGANRQSRLDQTTAVLAATGATAGRIYGRFSDRSMYEALLAGQCDVFAAIVDELAHELRSATCVIADAAEGYNPSHDVCRIIVDAAVQATGRAIPAYEFALAPDAPPRAFALSLELDDAAFARKWAAARAYRGLEGEVREMEHRGLASLRVEGLSLAHPAPVFGSPPFYEQFGAQRVAEGSYTDVIRQAHILQIAEALGQRADAA
jgi:hypothetical protein